MWASAFAPETAFVAAIRRASLARRSQPPRHSEGQLILCVQCRDNAVRGVLSQGAPRSSAGVFKSCRRCRVSSGKSSLLNHILHTEVLPVGVNPITAVPTRLVFGREGLLSVTLTDRQVKHFPIGELEQYASEERNPGNQLGVARLIVRLPSPRLQDGLVLVDTPGLGALATAGAAETLAYLPQCDLGILLISAVNPINDEDLNTIYALSQAGIPVMVLLSKADLLSPEDRIKARAYTKQEVGANLNLNVTAHPVSTVPGYEELLEQWFRDELAPLCSRHRELAEQSVRRKAGALREAVLAALRSKLGRPARSTPADSARLQDIERRLREAAGGIEEARRFCLSATDEVRSLGLIAIERAAAATARSWNGGSPSAPGAVIVPNAIHETVAQVAAQISARLRAVALELDSTLNSASREFGGGAEESALEDCLREMPRFEAAFPEFSLNPPWFRFLKGLAHSWAMREIRQGFEEPLGAAFANYGRALEAWSRKVLGEMHAGFDTRADAYRAQLARLTTGTSISDDQRKRIEADIARLEQFTPAGSDHEPTPHGDAPADSGRPESAAPLVQPR